MNREFKSLSFTNLKAKSTGRIRVGVCAVMGNVDSWGDRIQPGAFTKTISEGKGRVRHLWNHDNTQPPIASIKELRELTRDELPAEVLAKAPDATGGLLVSREYYDLPFSNWILQCIDSDDINEMSFAYDTIKSADVTEDTGLDDMPKRHIRNLLELKLFDTSDVNWGMNGATVAVGAKNSNQMPLGAIAAQLKSFYDGAKSGQRNSSNDLELLKQMHNLTLSLGVSCETAKSQAQQTADSKTETTPAEAAKNSTSLDSDWLELQGNELKLLTI